MLFAAFEPGKEMAIANFFLAVFCLFTVALPLLLVTRGDKTEANRKFLAATVNPWSQVFKEDELTQVVLSEITPSANVLPNLETVTEPNFEINEEPEKVISLEIKVSSEDDESSAQSLSTRKDLMTA